MADNYIPVLELGSGAFGKAWLVTEKSRGRQLVSKVIKIKGLSKTELDRCITEVAILSACNHANIVRYIEAFVSLGNLHIVMEYAKEGDLHQRMRNQQGTPLQREVVLEWFVQIVLALDYIHSRNILHRDLKPQNVFIMEDNTLKLGDFGIAKVLCSQKDFASTMIGTPYYISPEICQGKQYNSSSDMWAAGCLLYQMCHLEVPFDAPSLTELYQKILQCCYKPIPSHYDVTIPYLVSKLLTVTPDDRLLAKDILGLPELSPLITKHTQRQVSYKRIRSRPKARSHQEVKAIESEQTLPEKHGNISELKNKPRVAAVAESKKVCPVMALKPMGNVEDIDSDDRDKIRTVSVEQENMLKQCPEIQREHNSSVLISTSAETVESWCKADNKQNQRQDPELDEDCSQKHHAPKYSGRESCIRCVSENSPGQPAYTKSKTYTVKNCVARRLSEASPKLSTTLAKQRFALSMSDPEALHQVQHVDQRDAGLNVKEWDMAGEGLDDVFSPTVMDGASNIVDTKTYVVERKDSVDPNNNAVGDLDDVKASIVEALSVSGFNKEMARGMLLNALVCRVGHDRSTSLINKIRKTVVENGHGYRTLQVMLNIDEIELIPLLAMLCW